MNYINSANIKKVSSLEDNNILFFAYGSLKRKFSEDKALSDSGFLGKAVFLKNNGYNLVNFGSLEEKGYKWPGLAKSTLLSEKCSNINNSIYTGQSISGEAYLISKKELEKVKRLHKVYKLNFGNIELLENNIFEKITGKKEQKALFFEIQRNYKCKMLVSKNEVAEWKREFEIIE